MTINTKTFAIAYVSALAVFGVEDFFWLSLVAGPLFEATMGGQFYFRPVPAIAFYLIYPIGLAVFAVMPAIRLASLAAAAADGAGFGFFAYATYDLTNLATLRDYTFELALVDLAYGTLVSSLAAGSGYAVAAVGDFGRKVERS
jgi:uncharacterized membrane protein